MWEWEGGLGGRRDGVEVWRFVYSIPGGWACVADADMRYLVCAGRWFVRRGLHGVW